MVIFYKKWKKYNEIQLTNNKMALNIRKMTNHPPSPVTLSLMKNYYILYISYRKCKQIYSLTATASKYSAK